MNVFDRELIALQRVKDLHVPRDQITERRLGASHIAGVLGVSSFSSPFDVYLDLIEHYRPDATLRMRNGKRFERTIADWHSEETGIWHAWIGDTPITHPHRVWQRIAPDMILFLDAEDGLGEIKRTAYAAAIHGVPGTDDIGDYEMIQIQTYMEALRSLGFSISMAQLIVHDLHRDDLLIYPVPFDPVLGEMIVEAGERFWRDHIVPKAPPPISGSKNAKQYLEQKYPRGIRPVRDATAFETRLACELLQLKTQISALSERESIVRNLLRESIGDYRSIRGPFGSITWTNLEAKTYTTTKPAQRVLSTHFKRDARLG